MPFLIQVLGLQALGRYPLALAVNFHVEGIGKNVFGPRGA